MLVGTKADLHYRREVSSEEAMQLAKSKEMMFMETSAQTSNNVEDAFLDVATSMPYLPLLSLFLVFSLPLPP
jgi:GTPase SAR1 family protein